MTTQKQINSYVQNKDTKKLVNLAIKKCKTDIKDVKNELDPIVGKLDQWESDQSIILLGKLDILNSYKNILQTIKRSL